MKTSGSVSIMPFRCSEVLNRLVTGCSSGIGAALAKHAHEDGAFVVATARKPEALSYLPDKADVLKEGKDLTVISYGQPLYLCSAAIEAVEKEVKGLSVELIDLRAIYPWDRETVLQSVNKTGRAVVVHESMLNAGVGAEVAASIQEGAFLKLEAPVARVTGWTTHSPLVFERFNVPDVARIYDGIKRTLDF